MSAPPNGAVTELHDLMVPMRDGIQLATDVYLPADTDQLSAQAVPVIMERTPYGKSAVSRAEVSAASPEPMTRRQVARFFASHGYAVVMQDCRGRYASAGQFVKYINEAEDGVDTLGWIRQQPWCDGRVATMGLSYGAHTQLALACLAPQGLACMLMDSGGFSSAYHGGIRRGGAFELKQATWAYKHALKSPATVADSSRKHALQARDIVDWFQHMPWRPGHSPLQAAPEYENYLFEQWRNGLFSDYWKQIGLYAEGHYDRIPDIPITIIGSWYDPYVLTCITNFTELSRRHRSATRLLMGPWTHGNRSRTWAGEVDFGPHSILDGQFAPDYLHFRLDWFNQCLKPGLPLAETGGPEPEQNKPPQELTAPGGPKSSVSWFEMGGGSGRRDVNGRLQHGGQWCHSTQWPPPQTRQHELYLHADGRLAQQPPASRDGALHYRHDPAHPVPTLGGALTSGEPVMEGGPFDQRVRADTFQYQPDDPIGPLSQRADVLVFTTEPLAQDLVLCGELQAELWISSDCPDTDFTVKLIDVYPPSDDYPEGFAMNICDGIFRVRYRQGWQQEVFLQPDEICRIVVVPFATANRFCAGHRLRVDVSSSNYPHFDINTNTGEAEGSARHNRIATNTLHCNARHPSRLILPLLPSRPEPHGENHD